MNIRRGMWSMCGHGKSSLTPEKYGYGMNTNPMSINKSKNVDIFRGIYGRNEKLDILSKTTKYVSHVLLKSISILIYYIYIII